MDIEKLFKLWEDIEEKRSDLIDLSHALLQDVNNTHDDKRYDYLNARDRCLLLINDINIIHGMVCALNEFYDLLHEMESEKDKFLVSKKINNVSKCIDNSIRDLLKDIRELNLYDYRVVEVARDCRYTLEKIKNILQKI